VDTVARQQFQELNLVEILLLQHQQQRAVLDELHGAAGERGAASFQRLVRMLAVHESVEEIVLYPVVRANFDDGRRLARLAIEQESEIKDALADLQSGDLARGHHLATVASRNRIRELEEMVHAHHDLEERQIIAVLPQLQDAPQLGGLATAFEMATHLAPTRGHHRAPTGPLANVLLGTPVAVLDKARDRRARGDRRQAH
jgi:hemerythrin superfamily protein